jgi:hypothetical protein
MSQLSLGPLGGVVLDPACLDEQRGAWCTPLKYTSSVGPFDLDPFTNPRSTLRARHTCMLERGDDGFGLDRRSAPGAFYVASTGHHVAVADWRVWIQPPYSIVLEALAHYGHTRFTALLRLDPSTEWFERLHALSEVIMVPRGDRIAFVPPPGVVASSNPFPHGIFYRRAADVTDAIAALCYEWRVA